jgi:hypothetical protein
MKTKGVKLRRPAESEVAFVQIEGVKSACEPESVEIRFPWGSVTVTRATDTERPDYWVHVYRNHPEAGHFIPGETQEGRIADARLDIVSRHARDVKAGPFKDKNLYHLAVRIGPALKR